MIDKLRKPNFIEIEIIIPVTFLCLSIMIFEGLFVKHLHDMI